MKKPLYPLRVAEYGFRVVVGNVYKWEETKQERLANMGPTDLIILGVTLKGA